MFKESELSNELADLMSQALYIKKEASGLVNIAEAYDLLSKAADLFDDVGFSKEAEFLTKFLENDK